MGKRGGATITGAMGGARAADGVLTGRNQRRSGVEFALRERHLGLPDRTGATDDQQRRRTLVGGNANSVRLAEYGRGHSTHGTAGRRSTLVKNTNGRRRRVSIELKLTQRADHPVKHGGTL